MSLAPPLLANAWRADIPREDLRRKQARSRRLFRPGPPCELYRQMQELPSERFQEWQRAMAEEWLLASLDPDWEAREDWYELLAGVSPFEHGPPLRELRNRPIGCARFPVAADRPFIARIWSTGEHSARWWHADSPQEAGFHVVAAAPFNGTSWQLAGYLASRATDDTATPVRSHLAQDWLCTGSLADRPGGPVIRKVRLEGKLGLADRRWLIPAANLPDLSPANRDLEIRSAADADAAWGIVSGSLSPSGGTRPWPQIGHLHILVGGDPKAAIASMLYCGPDVPVTLWHSPELAPAEILQIVAGLGLLVPASQELSSSNLQDAERVLWEHLQHTTEPVLFNITSATRLMSYAVQNVARRVPSLQLVYRNLTAARPHDFIHLDYSQLPPATETYQGTSPPEFDMTILQDPRWLPPETIIAALTRQSADNA